MKRPNSLKSCLTLIAAASGVVGTFSAQNAQANTYTWANSGALYSTPGDWTANSGFPSATTDEALFNSTPSIQPTLDVSASIGTLAFTNTAGGWTLSSNSGSNILTLNATTALISANTSNTNTISANLATPTGTPVGETWYQATSGTLSITGSISEGTVASPLDDSTISFGSSGNTGTILLNPSSGNSITIVSNNAGSASGGTPLYAQYGTLALGDVSSGSPTTSNNIIVNTANPALRYGSSGAIVVNSGTWRFSDAGGNNSNTTAGKLSIVGGSLITGGARYIAGDSNAVLSLAGGFLGVSGSGNSLSNTGFFAIGYRGSATANISSGFLDVAKAPGGQNQIGNVSSSTALVNQTGGVAQFGVTGTYNSLTGAAVTNGSNTGLTIGQSSTNSNVLAAYTMTGGRLNIYGTLAGGTSTGTGNISNFNFLGGTLTVGTINAGTLTSNQSATATTGQTSSASNLGTFENYGGTLAPGGSIVTNTPDVYGDSVLTLSPTTGKTALTGNYAGNGGSSTLAFDLAGKTASSAFQDTSSNTSYFSLLAVTGSVSLNDALNVSLLNGLNPVGDSFQIMTFSSLTGTFDNLTGTTGTTADGGYSFSVVYGSNNITLNNFQAVPEPASVSALSVVGWAATRRRIRRRR